MDFTEEIKSIDWSKNKNEVTNQFSQELNEITNGLYLLIFENKTNLDIRDNSKVVCPANSLSIKPGKFENGAFRYKSYYEETHIDGTNINNFNQCLIHAQIFDLGDDLIIPRISNTRYFENLWKESIFHYSESNGFFLEFQNKRSEYRFLSLESEIESIADFSEARSIIILNAQDYLRNNI
jgi:hypothetical protein